MYSDDDHQDQNSTTVGKIDRNKLESSSGASKGNRGGSKSSAIKATESKTAPTSYNAITSGKNNKKISNGITNETSKIVAKVKSSIGKFGNVRSANCSVNLQPDDQQLAKSKEYCSKKFTNELGSKFKNSYQSSDYIKENRADRQQDYKSRSIVNSSVGFSNHITAAFQRVNNSTHSTRDENNRNASSSNVYAATRKALDQQSSAAKPVNFPPLRAPQSIVNVRHPFVTEARTKCHSEAVSNGPKSKSSAKELEPRRQSYNNNFGTSGVSVAASMSPYPRPEPFPHPSSMLMAPDSAAAQFSQSAATSYSAGQFPSYDHASFHASTPVMQPQFPADNSGLSFPQYDGTSFVAANHYSPADLSSSQFQYQAGSAAVGQMQEPPMFIQSLPSPLAMADQYATTNYARAVRTEVMHTLRRPARFNK